MTCPMKLKALLAAAMLVVSSLPAHAVLERVGPISNAPSIGGYPTWYQDTSGLTLEFCDPKNQLEVDGGWCLLLPADVRVPEVFPGNFFDEHFYYAASALMTTPAGAKALLDTAMEGAFAAGPARPGDQITFTRIRLRLNPVPLTGTYRIIHPYGEDRIDAIAGDRIFFTEDIGIGAPGDFSGALASRLGPFLIPSNTPGGAELPPVAGPAGLYLADPARSGPVTGSALPDFTDSQGNKRNHNIFRIEGPAGSALGGPGIDFIETTNFALMGRIFTGALPGRIDVKRANYSRNVSGQKLHVYASAFPTVQTRVPPAPKPVPVQPGLSFFAARCGGTVDPVTGNVLPPYTAPAGAVAIPMSVAGNDYWGQTLSQAIPPAVCVQDTAARDALGNPVPLFAEKPVTDAVTITQAIYDANAQVLSVSARSSDVLSQPTLTLTYGTQEANLVSGKISVPSLTAPPDKIRVRSSALGYNDYQVEMPGPADVAPRITSMPLLTAISGKSYAYKVIAYDADGGTLTFTLDKAPTGMTLTSATASSAWIGWWPGSNQSGLQDVTLRVTDPTGLFSTQAFRVNVTSSSNRPPVVANDAYTMIKGGTLNVAASGVLANDSDPDAGDTITATNFVAPTAGTFAGRADGGFSYTPSATFTGMTKFSYLARDNSGLTSQSAGFVSIAVRANLAPVTVDDNFVTSTNVPATLNVLVNDSDPDTAIDPTNHLDPATVFIPVTGAPDKGGTVTVNADGSISYTPKTGFSGTETFSYAVRDTYSTPAISRATKVTVNVQ